MTIYDVAREAGVAASTVSRALTRPGRVNATTAEHVRATAERLGYQAGARHGSAAAGGTRLLGVVVPDLTNPLFAQVVRGAELAAAEHGYTLLTVDGQESEDRERAVVDRILGSVEGVILTGPRMSEAGIRAVAKRRPTVVLNRVVRGQPCVLTDSARGTRRAAEHLGSLGHQRITYLAGPEASWADAVRWRALREAALELELRARRVGPVAPTVAGGEQAARLWAQRPTSAVLAYNDLIAIGFVRGVRAMGLRVPANVSVVGFDNTDLGALGHPALTSVASPQQGLGTAAARNLVAMLAGARPTAEPLLLPVKLVVRDTTARRRGEPFG
ncbi:LacI family DNA-binding transcriptional regulator [Georgenia faecalis]|uniref:LacI family DNA-binding transcriptional regulator n=1 Tax=Georgenia faecalis TaxID=2483799 RepID=A0ABV9D8Y7_9MICO|nr:LacI family DNA-binding transcriptional regulator [Georgenia faecalis]